MTFPANQLWKRRFIGRDAELALLRDRLLKCAPSLAGRAGERAVPTVMVLVGDSGQGKSRLVQEFYRRIACSPGQGGLDAEGYWPDAFADPDASAKGVNPAIPAGHTVGKHPSFIWWGVRWPEPPDGCAPSMAQLTAPAFLDLLEVHRDGRRRRVEKMLDVAARGAKLATNSLIPGLDDVPILKQVQQAIQASGDARDVARAIEDGREGVRDWLKGQDAARAAERRARSALGIVRRNLLRILDPVGIGPMRDAATPLVLWLDDAQWMTPDEAACLHGLLVDAARSRLPLFVVATHWESDWRRAQAELARARTAGATAVTDLHGVVHGLASGVNAGRSAQSVVLEQVMLDSQGPRRLDLGPCLDAALPGLTAPQRAQVLRLAGGNPLLFRLIVDDLERYPARFEGGVPTSCLTAEAERDLSSIAAGEARRTFVGRRIRDLDIGVRRVLEMGSMQGSEFLREVTCEAAAERGIHRDEAMQALENARSEAILDDDPGGPTLVFRQDIYRDVLQGSLGEQERRSIEAAIRSVLVRLSLDGADRPGPSRDLINELASRFLAAPGGQVDWGSRESMLWIRALVEHLEALDRHGLDIQALAKAREIVAIDARSPEGIPLAVLGPERAIDVLRVLARFGTDSESLAFGERMLARVRGGSPTAQGPAVLDMVMRVAELRGAIAEQALYAAALRGAQAALAEGDPLSARLALEAAPAAVRGPEHGMLAHDAGRRAVLLRAPAGGNPYRLRDLPGSGYMVALFDNTLEVIHRRAGSVSQHALGCLSEQCPAMRLDTSPTEEPGVFLVAVGSTSYPAADRPPQVHLHELRIRHGAYELRHLWTCDSSYWGDAAFLSATQVAIPTRHGTVAVHEARSGAVIREFPLPPDAPGAVSGVVAIDASRVALAMGDEVAELSLVDGGLRRDLHRHRTRINAMRISPDRGAILVGGGRLAVSIDRARGAVSRFGGIEGDVWDVECSPDGRHVVVVGGDCMVRLFEAGTARPIQARGAASGITWATVWDEEGIFISAEGGEVLALDPEDGGTALSQADERVINVDPVSGARMLAIPASREVVLRDASGVDVMRVGGTDYEGYWRIVPGACGTTGPVAYRLRDRQLVAFGPDGAACGSTSFPEIPQQSSMVAPGGDRVILLVGMAAFRVSGVCAALRGGPPPFIEEFAAEGVPARWASSMFCDRAGQPMIGRMDGTVYEWSGATPAVVVLGNHWIQAAAHLEDGGWVLGNHNGRVQRVLEGTTVWSIDLRRAYVRSIACCEATGRCFVLMANGPLHVLRLDSGEPLCMLGKVDHGECVLVPRSAAEGVDVIRSDGTVRRWRRP